MQFIKFILLSSLLLVGTAFGQSKLPACKGSDTTKWSNCIGTATFEDSVYVGEWKNGKSHGQGTETFANGNKYVGDYKDDKRRGQGTYTLPDGAKYVGEWKDNKAHGQGTETFANGDKYVGKYKDGKMHGQGIFTASDGTVLEGIWEDGKFIREAKVNPSNSNSNSAKNKGVNNIESSKSVEASPFIKEHPFYAHIECPGFQLNACIDNLRVINGGVSKNYGITELMLIASSGDGVTNVDREFYFAFIHLKRNFNIVVQNSTDHPSLRVRVFSKTASGEMNEVIFDKTTSRKYEVIRVSN